MLETLLGGLVDKEKATKEALENTIEDIADDLKINQTDIFIMIKPVSKVNFDFKIYLYHVENSKAPVLLREMTLKEFIGQNE